MADDLSIYSGGNQTSLGTAKWASKAQWSKQIFQPGDFWLSRSIDADEVPIGHTDDRHVLLVSGSRGGKGATVIVNNLCLWHGSAVVVDPKGENAIITARRRGQGSTYCDGLGQRVRILDPFNTVKRDDDDFSDLKVSFNPLDAIEPDSEEAIDEAGRIADALVVVQATNDPFWEESARTLIRALILHVLTDAQFEGQRNLVTVRNLIARGDWIGLDTIRTINQDRTANGEEPLYEPENPFDLLWAGMADNDAYDGIVAGAGNSFANMSEKARDSILQVSSRNTEFMDSPGIRRCLSSSDFSIDELKNAPEGSTLYLSLPQRFMNTHFRWLRMMITLTITEMEQVKGNPATGQPILMVLDEFAGLKKMDVIENATAQIAGFGVKLFFIVQSLGQLKETYKENWEVFLANAGTKLFFNIDDGFSRDYVSKYLGEAEVMRSTSSSSFSENVSRNVSTSQSTSVSSSQSRGRSTTRNTSFDPNQKPSGSRARNFSASSSSSASSSTSSSYGSGETHTTGTTESLHKRPLITPDELGRFFARVDDPSNPAYPGLLIASISGAQPLVLRKSNYFEDPDLRGCFDPHPNHAPPPTLSETQATLRDERKQFEEEAERSRLLALEQERDRERQKEQEAKDAMKDFMRTCVILVLLFLSFLHLPAMVTREFMTGDGWSWSSFFLNYPYLNFFEIYNDWLEMFYAIGRGLKKLFAILIAVWLIGAIIYSVTQK